MNSTNPKIAREDVALIPLWYAQGFTMCVIAHEFGVTTQRVQQIVSAARAIDQAEALQMDAKYDGNTHLLWERRFAWLSMQEAVAQNKFALADSYLTTIRELETELKAIS